LPRTSIKAHVIVRDVVLVVSFALLTAVCAKIKLQIGIVPITMQTFAVILSGLLLGSRRGALSQITYLFGGLSGILWFSLGGGMAYLMSPTLGYIVGFIFAAFIVGKLAERGWDRKLITTGLAMIIGLSIVYFFGLLWLARFVPADRLLAAGLIPFLPGEVLKVLLAGLLLPLGWKLIGKSKKFPPEADQPMAEKIKK